MNCPLSPDVLRRLHLAEESAAAIREVLDGLELDDQALARLSTAERQLRDADLGELRRWTRELAAFIRFYRPRVKHGVKTNCARDTMLGFIEKKVRERLEALARLERAA